MPTAHEHLARTHRSGSPPVLCTLRSARAAPDDVDLLPRPFDVALLRELVTRYVVRTPAEPPGAAVD